MGFIELTGQLEEGSHTSLVVVVSDLVLGDRWVVRFGCLPALWFRLVEMISTGCWCRVEEFRSLRLKEGERRCWKEMVVEGFGSTPL